MKQDSDKQALTALLWRPVWVALLGRQVEYEGYIFWCFHILTQAYHSSQTHIHTHTGVIHYIIYVIALEYTRDLINCVCVPPEYYARRRRRRWWLRVDNAYIDLLMLHKKSLRSLLNWTHIAQRKIVHRMNIHNIIIITATAHKTKSNLHTYILPVNSRLTKFE